jgi:DNA-binding IscR family transcriptional regulator
VALTACVDTNHGLPCAHEAHCALVGGWTPVNDALRSALSSVSLADMIPTAARAVQQPRADLDPASVTSPIRCAPRQVARSPSLIAASSNHG